MNTQPTFHSIDLEESSDQISLNIIRISTNIIRHADIYISNTACSYGEVLEFVLYINTVPTKRNQVKTDPSEDITHSEPNKLEFILQNTPESPRNSPVLNKKGG